MSLFDFAVTRVSHTIFSFQKVCERALLAKWHQGVENRIGSKYFAQKSSRYHFLRKNALRAVFARF